METHQEVTRTLFLLKNFVLSFSVPIFCFPSAWLFIRKHTWQWIKQGKKNGCIIDPIYHDIGQNVLREYYKSKMILLDQINYCLYWNSLYMDEILFHWSYYSFQNKALHCFWHIWNKYTHFIRIDGINVSWNYFSSISQFSVVRTN